MGAETYLSGGPWTLEQSGAAVGLTGQSDFLGLDAGGADDLGHIGAAAAPGWVPFGLDVVNDSHVDED